jgi:vacuolar-type H+-ATPase subunit C/Vma6
MDKVGERAYIYAKICGIIGKSFVGKRIAGLGAISRLSDMDRLVFPAAGRELPERELLPDIEDRITARSIKEIITIINCFKNPPPLLTLLLRSYEYTDLKNVLAALHNGETTPPAFTDIGHFRTVRFEAYPNLETMLRGTDFDFLLKEDIAGDIILVQIKLDQQYYAALWEALAHLSRMDRNVLEKIISEEIDLRNAVWALRLRLYYRLSTDKIKKMLISIEGKKSFSQNAIESLSFSLDTQSEWSRWKWSKFVNNERTATYWEINPRYFQNAASQYLYRRTYHALRARPFSLDTAFCFIRLKQFEEELLTSIAEGLSFGMTSRETMDILEAQI